MNQVLIICAIALFVLQSLSLKLVKADTLSEKLLSNCCFTMLAAGVLLLLGIPFPGLLAVSPSTLLWGILFGICFSLTILCYLSAIACGPLSYTSFYLSASMLLPAAAGILLFGEALKGTLVLAVLFFLAAFYLLNVTGGDKKAASQWILFCLLTFLCNGLSGIVQKSHQYILEGQEAAGLMLVGFFTASLCYGTAFGVSRRVRNAQPFNGMRCCLKKNILPIILLASASLGGNLLLTYLAGHNAGSYLFPLIQGSIILGVSLCSVLFFHEKLSVRGKLGILAGTLGIVMINL